MSALRAALDSAVLEALKRRRIGPPPEVASLIAYTTALYPTFEAPWHLRVLAEKLEAVARGENKRLMVFMPPRHGKSLLSSWHFPAWYLGRNPQRSIIAASYSQDLASDFGRKVRNTIVSDRHATIFPRSVLASDSSSIQRFALTEGGSYFAVGRGGPLTGRGADLLLIDDPIKDREEAESPAVRRALHTWFSQVAFTRLQPGGAVIVINTRWHEEDLSGHLLQEHADEGWAVVSLPAIAEEDEEHRQEGEALWPERWPAAQLAKTRPIVGPAGWASLYQQRPAAAEGAIFKRTWWGRYTMVPRDFLRVVQSWDTAFKAGEANDYSACTTWGETSTGFYLLNAWRGRIEFPELVRKARELAAEWSPSAVLVEDKASGQSLVQSLKASTSLPVLPIKVGSDKVSRANAVTPTIAAGRVHLPQAADWLEVFTDDLSQFPYGKHDDFTDTTTMALAYLTGRTASTGTLRTFARPERRLGIIG